jgi:GxxExxY protein
MKATLLRDDLIHPDLSFKIVGCAFDVFNSIGFGHLEKVYQNALAIAFEKIGLKFAEQVKREIIYEGKKLGYGKLDFLVEDKIVVEIKRGNYFNPADFDQVKKYLDSKQLQLGILIRFTPDKVLFKRVVNSISERPENIVMEERSINEKSGNS